MLITYWGDKNFLNQSASAGGYRTLRLQQISLNHTICQVNYMLCGFHINKTRGISNTTVFAPPKNTASHYEMY